MQEEQNSGLFYRVMLAVSAFISAVGFFAAFNVFARLVPTFLSGVLWLQIALLIGGIILIKWTDTPLAKFVGGMLIGVLIFAAIGGFWDGFLFAINNFEIHGVKGTEIVVAVFVLLGFLLVEMFLKGAKNEQSN